MFVFIVEHATSALTIKTKEFILKEKKHRFKQKKLQKQPISLTTNHCKNRKFYKQIHN